MKKLKDKRARIRNSLTHQYPRFCVLCASGSESTTKSLPRVYNLLHFRIAANSCYQYANTAWSPLGVGFVFEFYTPGNRLYLLQSLSFKYALVVAAPNGRPSKSRNERDGHWGQGRTSPGLQDQATAVACTSSSGTTTGWITDGSCLRGPVCAQACRLCRSPGRRLRFCVVCARVLR